MLYKIAGVIFEIKPKHKYLENLCADYLVYGVTPDCVITVSSEDIEAERENEEVKNFPEYYLESTAVFRKICDYILKNKKGILFHSSAVAVNGNAYLFTAPSGTGKSTHAKLWKDMLKDKMVYVNDDKPIIRLENGECYVYGTPWNGKHKLGNNLRVKVAAICEIRRGKENRIEEISAGEMLKVAFNQTVVPASLPEMDEYLDILNVLLKNTRLFRLYCNTDPQAAEVSYKAMVKE